jgi:hypothetical protein
MTSTHAPERLLIVACSASKRNDEGLLPASRRYTGVAYTLIHRWLREERAPTPTGIAILSAAYGLIAWDAPIAFYNRLMTSERAYELQASLQQQWAELITAYEHLTHIHVHAGQVYRNALQQLPLAATGARTTWSSGGIGVQLGQLKRWLQTSNPIQDQKGVSSHAS